MRPHSGFSGSRRIPLLLLIYLLPILNLHSATISLFFHPLKSFNSNRSETLLCKKKKLLAPKCVSGSPTTINACLLAVGNPLTSQHLTRIPACAAKYCVVLAMWFGQSLGGLPSRSRWRDQRCSSRPNR